MRTVDTVREISSYRRIGIGFVPDDELLDRLVFGNASGAVGAPHGLDMPSSVLGTSSVTALARHFSSIFASGTRATKPIWQKRPDFHKRSPESAWQQTTPSNLADASAANKYHQSEKAERRAEMIPLGPTIIASRLHETSSFFLGNHPQHKSRSSTERSRLSSFGVSRVERPPNR